jgi:hypothetical protein
VYGAASVHQTPEVTAHPIKNATAMKVLQSALMSGHVQSFLCFVNFNFSEGVRVLYYFKKPNKFFKILFILTYFS